MLGDLTPNIFLRILDKQTIYYTIKIMQCEPGDNTVKHIKRYFKICFALYILSEIIEASEPMEEQPSPASSQPSRKTSFLREPSLSSESSLPKKLKAADAEGKLQSAGRVRPLKRIIRLPQKEGKLGL